MKKFLTILITVIVTLVVVFGLGAVFSRKNGANQPKTEVIVENPRIGRLVEIVSAPGEIEPKTKVSISAKISARVDALPFEEGDRVTAGDPDADPPVPASVLVKLDAKDLESQLKSVQANKAALAAQIEVEKANIAGRKASLTGLEASLEQARKDLQRQQQLLKSRDISESTYDQTRLRVEQLEADHLQAKQALEAAQLNQVVLEHNIEAAQARIDQAREALEYTTIRSPIDGVVTRLNAEVGEVVITGTMNNPGTVIMQVADLSTMMLVAQVDETDVARIREGARAVVHVHAYPDQEFNGTVESIALSHDYGGSGTKYFKTRILLETNGRRLFSGLTADVDIEAGVHEDVMLIPSQAVLGRRVEILPRDIKDNSPEVDLEKIYATVVYRYQDGKTVVTPVRTGTSDVTQTIILSGLSVEDQVITGPFKVLDALGHDQDVQLMSKEEPEDQQDPNQPPEKPQSPAKDSQ